METSLQLVSNIVHPLTCKLLETHFQLLTFYFGAQRPLRFPYFPPSPLFFHLFLPSPPSFLSFLSPFSDQHRWVEKTMNFGAKET